MSDPRIPRISEQAREARRPLPVSTLLSARHETIHRDPGAARAARSVKVSDKLTDEVEEALAAFGDTRFSYSKALDMARLSIAKAIRVAEAARDEFYKHQAEHYAECEMQAVERMRERAAKVCDAEADQSRRDGYLDQMDTELRLSKKIRSLPLENA